MVLTPLTTSAGQWLYNQLPEHAAILETHQERGQWMIYIAIALLVVAAVQAIQHWMESRSSEPKRVLAAVAALLAVVIGGLSIVGVVLIGDAGSAGRVGPSGNEIRTEVRLAPLTVPDRPAPQVRETRP